MLRYTFFTKLTFLALPPLAANRARGNDLAAKDGQQAYRFPYARFAQSLIACGNEAAKDQPDQWWEA